jgi:hypothetical protein
MQRAITAFVAAALTWVVVVSLIDRGLRLFLDGYALAEPDMAFTLGMMVARLVMAAVTSLIAGAVAAAIAPAVTRVPWLLGALLLVLFLPSHVMLWSRFPVWYHLTFLLTLVPLVVIGSRLWRSLAPARLAPRPAAPTPGS